MLQCHAKSCPQGQSYPLAIRNAELEQLDAEFNADFVTRLMPKLDWAVLRKTAFELGVAELPAEIPTEPTQADLQLIHKVALETRIKEADMVCNGCGHVYPIKDGVPNMLLQDHEI
ncbi:hypothetical protein PhCBS80983_g05268 [Powellomyces hirtus]|uniref:Trm112p-like protein n=1 Tax=Powellomyces hirtus TaxID=109895 RepID=A0A507DX84_9FUNG|nr:hypothetical protein PhCBS80983_g05268 [Powellomyces hirtus]